MMHCAHRRGLFALVFLLFLYSVGFTSQAWCNDQYVDPSAPNDNGAGSSWATAKRTIYGAYTAAGNGTKIHLRNTTHIPFTENIYITKEVSWVNENEDSNPEQCIILPSNHTLKVYGVKNSFRGITFQGGTGDCSVQIGHATLCIFYSCSFLHNQTTRNGGAVLVVGSDANYAESHFDHCKFDSNTANGYGGAIAGTRCKLSCRDCVFNSNRSLKGGGAIIVGMYYSSPPCNALFDSCTFFDNSGGGTGAVHLQSGEYEISRCNFEGNKALNEDSIGGAIASSDGGWDTNITINDCVFLGNESKGDGGAVRIANTYGTDVEKSLTFSVDQCLFSYNKAKNGGGLHAGRESEGTVSNCIFSYNSAYLKNAGGLYNSGTVKEGGWMVVEYCLFHHNRAEVYGGGMYIAEYPWTVIRNCTFYENTAGIDGDQIAGKSHIGGLDKATLINSICWGSGTHNQILGGANNTFDSVSFCCFPTGKLSDTGAATNRNINSCPNFVDPLNEDFSLSANSPCLNTGTDVGLPRDLIGNSVPAGSGVDIGAYELFSQLGHPQYTPAQDAGYFLWQDADDGEWHLRWSGDGIKTYHYTGTITSTSGFSNVTSYSLESNDRLQTVDTVISFDCYAGAGEDGVDFFTPIGAQVSFDLSVGGVHDPYSVHVGELGSSPNTIPFVLPSLGGVLGRPTYTPARDAGYFLWQDANDGRWHLRWSGDSIKTYHYVGTITSSSGFSNVTSYSFESNDRLQAVDTVISFDCYAGAGEDGVDFFIPSGAQVLFDIRVDDVQEPKTVRVGQTARTPATVPFTLTTLDTVMSPAPLMDVSPAGRPSYTAAKDAGYFLWQDPDDGEWHLRWSGDSVRTYFFSGSIFSTSAISNTTQYSFEGNDKLQIDHNLLSFGAYAGAGEDGLDFVVSPGALVSFDFCMDGTQTPERVIVGLGGAKPTTIPFAIETR